LRISHYIAIYVLGAVVTFDRMNMSELIPYDVLPWFFIYMVLNIIMIGSVMAAVGSTCNDSKRCSGDTVSLNVTDNSSAILIMPVILNPLGKLATGLSLFPLWTPMVMLLRQSTAVTIPLWQPLVGLAGVVILQFSLSGLEPVFSAQLSYFRVKGRNSAL